MTTVVAALLLAVAVALFWPQSCSRCLRVDRTLRRTSAGRLSAAAPGRRRLSLRQRGAGTEQAAIDEIEVLDALAPALRAGLPPVAALRLVTSTAPQGPLVLGDLDEAAARGEPLGPTWSAHAEAVDSDDLRFVAAAWMLCDTLGSPLAPTVSTISETVHRRRAVRQRIATALAGPQATMRILTALPLTGPLLALAVGLSPADLYAQPSAAVSILMGLVLLVLGRAWTSRMVRAVSAEPHGRENATRAPRLLGRHRYREPV